MSNRRARLQLRLILWTSLAVVIVMMLVRLVGIALTIARQAAGQGIRRITGVANRSWSAIEEVSAHESSRYAFDWEIAGGQTH